MSLPPAPASNADAVDVGRIITFYSYKGGTGRTMALANVACLLAEAIGAAQRVLVVDWDLEAPGLHRFFPPRLRGESGLASDIGLDATPGLIDLFGELGRRLPSEPASSEDAAEALAREAVDALALDDYVADTEFASIQIMRAGRNEDGGYSRRVGTFDWEGLFLRAPSVYRLLAERLARQYRYVLIDSRTGVTDTSGICTSLLPEKLVVVFTPNLQSLSGVRELVERATRYRRNSDDLRPLLVYPLASRIEPSRQDLRTRWRLGDRDRGIVGYQPMFEDLLAKAYGLAACDLSAYFDEVQIQQTADFAYGEQIATRAGGDRFSLANSYRVFVDRLVAAEPPWQSNAPLPVAPVVSTAVSVPRITPPAAFGVEPQRPATSTPTGTAPAPGPSPPRTPVGRIFVSHAHTDRKRIEPIVTALRARGFEVWVDSDGLVAGAEFTREVERALDASDAVLVCWSQESVASVSVRDEAFLARRRGKLIPVMLDSVAPPLGFGDLQSYDLTRDPKRGLAELVAALDRFVGAGDAVKLGSMAPSPRRTLQWGAGAGLAALVTFGVVLYPGGKSQPVPPAPAASAAVPPPSTPGPASVTMPNFVAADTADAARTASLLGLKVEMSAAPGQPGSEFIDGIVTAQTPAAGTALPAGSVVRLIVATQTTTAPTLLGTTLNGALKLLDGARLRLGKTTSVPVYDRPPGTIVGQRPAPGAKLPSGSAVDVDVAAEAKSPAQRTPVPSQYPPPPSRR